MPPPSASLSCEAVHADAILCLRHATELCICVPYDTVEPNEPSAARDGILCRSRVWTEYPFARSANPGVLVRITPSPAALRGIEEVRRTPTLALWVTMPRWVLISSLVAFCEFLNLRWRIS